MKLSKTPLSFLAGVLVGATVFGGSIVYATGVLATPTSDTGQTIILNGGTIELEGYLINGNNYFKLRDVAAAVDFGVRWDGNTQAVIIDSMVGYTPEEGEVVTTPEPAEPIAPTEPREDFSQEANSEIFDDVITREAYNVIRQAIVGETPISTEVTSETFAQMYETVAAIGVYPLYELDHYTVGYEGEISCNSRYPTNYDGAADYTDEFIQSIAGLSDKEKVREISFYVSDRLTYAVAYPSPAQVLTSDDVQEGACMAYARSFMFLSQQAGIPCVFIQSETHQWNEVYVDGEWWHVDVTGDDAGDEIDIRSKLPVLRKESDMQGNIFVDDLPTVTQFAKELLVPNSTR